MKDTTAEILFESIPALLSLALFAFLMWGFIESMVWLDGHAPPITPTPCSNYDYKFVTQVPARCIQYFINQNEKN